jgi:hypothetical protein
MEGIADLHVGTRNGDGTPQENVPSRNVGIVDLLPSICSSMGLSSEATLTDLGTVYEKSKQGLEMSIQRLIQNGGGIRVPKHPSKNSFCGKTVFKTMIKEKNPPDPILVATKAGNILSRQWGVKLLPGCSAKFGVGFVGSHH